MTRFDARTLWLILPPLAAMLPHAGYVPYWVSLMAMLTLAWRFSPFWRPNNRPQRYARLLLAGAGALATLLQFNTLLGPQAGISLLVIMSALKLLESVSRRDHTINVLFAYFMLIAVLIHHQDMAMVAWLLVVAVALTASLIVNQSSRLLPPIEAFRLAGGLLLQALPLAVLLFILFPRLPSPMSGLVHLNTGRTGLSEQMAPGSVSQLIQSDAVAFRVDFDQADFDARSLYWRGPVLPHFDGRTWRRGTESVDLLEPSDMSRPIAYTITLEASDQPWLPVTGLTDSIPVDSAQVNINLEWFTQKPRHDRIRYPVLSWLNYRYETDLLPFRRQQALTLPANFNPETVALARKWAGEASSQQSLINRALNHFRNEPFHYTLTPPLLGTHQVDDFLFQTRRGFCEHYASAFVVLMRAAGVPARVVTGYLGGDRNPVGGYWVVRDRDAHAWAEVWLPEAGWLRVDPTAAVAPQRVESGLSAALPAADRPMLKLPPGWLRSARQSWDYVNHGWNQWVLGYDHHRQQDLLSALSPSLASLKGMLFAMLTGAGLILAGLALSTLRNPLRKPLDPLEQGYQLFLSRLNRIGLVRRANEGPSDFAARAVRDRPDLAEPIQRISARYVALRYGQSQESAGRTGLNAEIRRFRVSVRAFKASSKS